MPMDNTPFAFSTDLPFKDEEVTPVTILSTETDEPTVLSPVAEAVKAAEQKAAQAPVRVKVCDRLRIVHEGKAYIGGETLSVPADLADKWLKFKFVEPVSRGKK